MRVVIIICLLAFTSSVFGQTIEWDKVYGGSNYEHCWGISKNAAGNILMVGHTLSNDFDVSVNHGDADCWVVCID